MPTQQTLHRERASKDPVVNRRQRGDTVSSNVLAEAVRLPAAARAHGHRPAARHPPANTRVIAANSGNRAIAPGPTNRGSNPLDLHCNISTCSATHTTENGQIFKKFKKEQASQTQPTEDRRQHHRVCYHQWAHHGSLPTYSLGITQKQFTTLRRNSMDCR